MVRARHKQVRDADVTSSDLFWRSVWRELRDQGSTNKRLSSRGLDDRYRYGCNPDGVEGVDVFLGEKAVLEDYANSKSGQLGRRPRVEAVETVDDVSVESAEERTDCQPDGSVEDGVDDEDEDGGDDGRVSSELLVDKDDSLNTVCDGDDSAEYAAMESGDGAAKDDLVMDEDSNEDDECTDTYILADEDHSEASETEIAADVLFAERFLDSYGGEDAVLAGNLKNDVLREMAASGWEDVDEPDTFDYMNTPYEPVDNPRSYPGLRQGYSGPTGDALRNADSPLALFFLPVVLW
ncbi:hypothetical protein PInf_005305 [Phytophthora infestans]|nr:hypothetical protein PInf_005305 [Phytophthora infestans]